ncbi:MAG TPA: GNAT family N-acetyltransferase, partial [Candidatus Angelobacter sp.]|nr:GNAT family N-acetyltransferase [Candidatus Angelobacter sp.]
GRICYEAFTVLNRHHNFPPDFPSPEVAQQVLAHMFPHPGFFCVVAEQDGKVIGSNCLDERSAIAGIGPITIDPSTQNQGAGRQLMLAVMDRAAARHFPGVRLTQAAFHGRSMSLYAKLGFDIREPLVVMQGPAIQQVPDGYSVRTAVAADLEACNALCHRIHGHDRSGELSEAITQKTARVVEHNGRITACSSFLGFFGFSIAESNSGLQALLGSADEYAGPGFLLPTRNSELFRWCLNHGLRVIEPMTLMSVGLYNDPAGAFLPSILY